MSHALPQLTCHRVSDAGAALEEVLTRGFGGKPAPLRDAVTGNLLPRALAASVETAWTSDRLLVAFACTESHVWASHTRRDAPLYEEEVVEVFLAPTGDLRHYYELELSPANVVFDARIYSPNRERTTMRVDSAWTCEGLETRTRVWGDLMRTAPSDADGVVTYARGWSAVFSIPFSAFPEVSEPRVGEQWRANFFRIERSRRTTFAAWSPTLEQPANFHVPDRFGFLHFVTQQGTESISS